MKIKEDLLKRITKFIKKKKKKKNILDICLLKTEIKTI